MWSWNMVLQHLLRGADILSQSCSMLQDVSSLHYIILCIEQRWMRSTPEYNVVIYLHFITSRVKRVPIFHVFSSQYLNSPDSQLKYSASRELTKIIFSYSIQHRKCSKCNDLLKIALLKSPINSTADLWRQHSKLFSYFQHHKFSL